MIAMPTGVSEGRPPSASASQDYWTAAATSATCVVAGVGITTLGIYTNPMLVLPGVSLAVEGVVGMSVVLAGGSSKDVLEVQEAFKYSYANIGETLVIKELETYVASHFSKHEGKEAADRVAATKNVISVLVGERDPKSYAESTKSLADLIKYWGEQTLHDKDSSSNPDLLRTDEGGDKRPARDSDDSARFVLPGRQDRFSVDF